MPVAALRDNGGGNKRRVALFGDDLNRARPSRLRSTDEIQWRFYYTQSEGLPPTVCQMYLFRQDENGSFVPDPRSPIACTELASRANGMDPLYKDFSDPTLSSAFFAQYGVKLPGLAAPALEPGVTATTSVLAMAGERRNGRAIPMAAPRSPRARR